MVSRITGAVAGVGLTFSGLLPWTADGLSGAYVAGLGGLVLAAGLVVAGITVAAPRNRTARWSMLVLSALVGLLAVTAVGFSERDGVGAEIGPAFYVMIASAGLGVVASVQWTEPDSDADGQTDGRYL